ncbi:MAG: 2-amino-4-hydroxy-6-hydroxymethyldihydropteridine diphosphokinase [Burkholderiaceae bacterium]|nr:2-amino-4-hydroxy-6-hydroxymethyldihydropteridine diphosphokinase [Burkholderiaceae bacterium]
MSHSPEPFPACPAAPPAVAAWIGLGANLGDCTATLCRALDALARLPGTRVQRLSALYRTAPVDATGPDYFNAVAEIATPLAPQALLEALQAIEHSAGRERPYRNAPRTLDLDILLYADQSIATPTLTVPHPRLGERAFVLHPLADIAPGRVAPQQLQSVAQQPIARTAEPGWYPGLPA